MAETNKQEREKKKEKMKSQTSTPCEARIDSNRIRGSKIYSGGEDQTCKDKAPINGAGKARPARNDS